MTTNDNWTDIDEKMESSLLHYSLDGISFQYNDYSLDGILFQYNDITPPLIPGIPGFYRKELM